MKKNNKIFALIVTSIIIITLLITGCQAQQKPFPPDENNDNNTNNPYLDNNGFDGSQYDDVRNPIVPDDYMVNELVTRGNRIANKIEEINGISEAKVIVTTTQKTAIVGLQPENYNGVTDALRRRIKSTIANEDRRIENVLITSNNAIYRRIDSIVSELNRGRSYSEFVDEIDAIQRSMAPIT